MEIVDGKVIITVEDTREELQDFLGEAQEIEGMEEEEQKERLEEIFGAEGEDDAEQEEEELPEEVQRRKDEILARQSSRANSDVALAMQISDQVAAESEAENPCYVVHGAKILCSQGSREARLVMPMDHGVLLNKHPQMTADDSASLTNVMCFGNCFSAENPNMEQAAVDATNQYNQKEPKGLLAKIMRRVGLTKSKVVASASKELQQLCICECKPCFSEEAFWEEGNEKSLVMGKKTLIQPATLVCQYGGVIRIVDNGQNG